MFAYQLIEALMQLGEQAQVVVQGDPPRPVAKAITKAGQTIQVAESRAHNVNELSLREWQGASLLYLKYPGHATESSVALNAALTGLIAAAGQASGAWHKTLCQESLLDGETRDEIARFIGIALSACAACATELGMSLQTIAAARMREMCDKHEREIAEAPRLWHKDAQ